MKTNWQGLMAAVALAATLSFSTAGVPAHPSVSAKVAAHIAKLDDALGAVIGKTNTPAMTSSSGMMALI